MLDEVLQHELVDHQKLNGELVLDALPQQVPQLQEVHSQEWEMVDDEEWDGGLLVHELDQT